MGQSRAIWQQAKAAVKSKDWEKRLKFSDGFGPDLDQLEKLLQDLASVATNLEGRVTKINHMAMNTLAAYQKYSSALNKAPTVTPPALTAAEAASLHKAPKEAALHTQSDWVEVVNRLDKIRRRFRNDSAKLRVH